MGESYTEADIKEGVKAAIDARKLARSRRTQVGIAYRLPSGWSVGFNTEPDVYTGGLHAEELGITTNYPLGYRSTDFQPMIEVYFDPTIKVQEAFPACAACWLAHVAFAHRNLDIVVARVEGDTVGTWKLKGNIFNITPPGELYPSEAMIAANPLSNSTPLGNGKPTDPTGQMRHRNDMDTVLDVALRFADSGVRLIPTPIQKVADSISVGTGDGHVFGGIPMQSKFYKGYSPEMVAMTLGMKEGNNGADYEVLGVAVPKYVPQEHTIGFLGVSIDFRGTMMEFGNTDPAKVRVVAGDHSGNRLYDGSIADILRNPEKMASFNKFFETQRKRLASEPKLARSIA